MTAAQLDWGDIQGTILRGYRVDLGRHFVLRVDDAAGARSFLGSLVNGTSEVPQVTTAARWEAKPDCFLNVGITFAGLAALGVPEASLSTFPAAFQRGATAPQTAALVGDTGDSDPQHWIGGLSDGASVHIILSLWVPKSAGTLDALTASLRTTFEGAATELSVHDVKALPDDGVHFGYRDSIAQPTITGAPPRKRPLPDCQPESPAGEFLLGHPNQNGGAIYRVQPEALSTNSSYAAFRILEQDVVGFDAFLTAGAATLGIDRELVAAKVCGRWRNGVPLVLSPDTPTPSPPVPPDQVNDFDYVSSDPALDDTFGYRCPVGSHIRRTNPRSEEVVGGGGHLHRIVRRAMPYGSAYDPQRPDDEPRGLIGFFINADLANQFEFLMANWINGPTFVKSVAGPDGANPVKNISGDDVVGGQCGTECSSFTISDPPPAPGEKPVNRQLTGFPRFVITRGGAYCYLPSITALRYLAAL